jgi:hypothetical protein
VGSFPILLGLLIRHVLFLLNMFRLFLLYMCEERIISIPATVNICVA